MPEGFAYDPPRAPLRVVHADRDIVVVDKPSGLLSVPGRGPDLADSALSRVRADHPAAIDVHRLDLDTSGLLLFALGRAAERELKRQFRERLVEKTYLAWVWGVVADDQGEVDLPLAPDPAEKLRHVVSPTGKPALTRYRVLRREAHTSLVELHPLTGRSHQLRVHLLALGHPILGDRFYADGPALAAAPRLMLHAAALSLLHPYRGAPVTFSSPPDW